MICLNCKKEIDSDSKFCEFCGSKINSEYKKIPNQTLKEKQPLKKKKDFSFFKKTILVASIYALSAFFIDLISDKYTDEMACFFFAIPMTILIIFIYGKIAKKFNL